ncbi:phosphoribosylanthranilate isomerase [Leptolyngbya sp. AN02str]|uniref:phosphoribosylanthranilate isomerase n=1 Tax=Leptolyngbya sp. AN02str TaxID=3423363 RepID=UPI003D30F9CD
MHIKICGITQPEQGRAIAQLGAHALGFICVRQSPRYVSAMQIRHIVDHLLTNEFGQPNVDRVGVFVNAAVDEIADVVAIANLNVVQLHGEESPTFCQQVRDRLPHIHLIKAFRIRSAETLASTALYASVVDRFLLDAYHPHHHGGTGQTLDWQTLREFRSPVPWLLAGGLTPDNVAIALELTQPHGIDLSSGVEHSPGNKDLQKVAQLFEQLHQPTPAQNQPHYSQLPSST